MPVPQVPPPASVELGLSAPNQRLWVPGDRLDFPNSVRMVRAILFLRGRRVGAGGAAKRRIAHEAS
jgi:hypothetical protein